jgi:hypothetical protein
MEDEGCIAPGGAIAIASALIQRMALPTRTAHELRYGALRDTGFIHLEPGFRIRTISPILKGGGYRLKAVEEQSGNTVTIRTGSEFMGMETAYYTVAAKPASSGLKVDLLSVERTIDGKSQPATEPVERFLDLPEWVSQIRLFFLTRAARSDNDVTIIGARSAALLELATERFQVDPDNYCKQEGEGVVCRAIPAGIAVAPMVAVVVNGTAVYVPPGSTVRQAAPAAPDSVRVMRRYGAQYLPVQPQADARLSNIVLLGGERISW